MTKTTIPEGAFIPCPNTIDNLNPQLGAKHISVASNCPACEHFSGIGDNGNQSPNWSDRFRIMCRFPFARHVVIVEIDK